MEKNVLEWLEKTAEMYPDKIAFASENSNSTFTEIVQMAKRLGSGILAHQVGDHPIALILNKDVTTIASFLGVVYSGHPYAPVDATLPDLRIEKILGILEPSLILTSEDNLEKVIRCSRRIDGLESRVELVDSVQTTEPDEEALKSVREKSLETDPLYIIFTSGSSGIPKGVTTSHHSLMCYIQAYTEVMGIDHNDVLGNQSPLDYIAAIRDIYIPLYKGTSTYLIPKNYFMQMDRLKELIDEKRITALGWSTSAMVLLSSFGITKEKAFQSVNKICFSGSVMPGIVLREWQEMLPDAMLVNQYGPTEATASCTYYVVDHLVDKDEIIPIGKPYRNYKIIILKEDETEAKIGETGEICVAGPILALGYYNNLEKTHTDFVQNPINSCFEERIYKTGDIGEMKKDGLIYFHGRKDRQIKHMGHRVELDEIELSATTISGVRECSAIYNHEQETIWLFYCGEAQPKEIITELRQQLPGFMIPRKVRKLECLPRLPNGKTDMVTLRAMTE